MSLIIKSNASTTADVLIADLGYPIPQAGGSVTLTSNDEIKKAQQSRKLRAYLVDDAYGAGSSTLILNDGLGDVAQADALNFLDILLLPAGDQDYGVVQTDDAGEITTNLVFDGTATVAGLVLGNDLDANGNEITGLPATPSGPTAAPSTAYVDGLFVQVRSWKELLIHSDQLLDGASGGVRQAGAFFLRNQPTSGDVLTIDDGSTPRDYGFGTGGDVTVTIGANIDDTLDNLAAAISGDGAGLWDAVVATDLESINDGTGAVTAGRVVVIYRAAQGADSYDDRLYGTFTTPADARYVNFNGESDYRLSTNSQVPSSDPAQKEFGIGRAYGSLATNETHLVRSGDTTYTWDNDGELWQLTGTGAISYGLVGDIQPLGSSLAAGTSNRVARADHVHTHGDRGGDGSASQHDADQIDVEGTYTTIGAPDDVEAVLGNIEDLFNGAAKCGKVLHAAYDDEVKSGEQFLMREGNVMMSILPYRFKRAGTLKAGQLAVDVVDPSNAFKLSVRKHATLAGSLLSANEVESVALPTSTQHAKSATFTTSIVADDWATLVIARTSGTTKSAFTNMWADIEWVE